MEKRSPIRWLAGIVLIPALVLAGSANATAQVENHLILKKKGYIDKMHFLTGDPVTFIRRGNDFPETYMIQGIGTNYIVISGQELPVDSIEKVIRLRTGFNFRASGSALLAAGPGYVLVGVVNALFRGTTVVPTATNLAVAGGLVAVGAILPAFQTRTYRLGKRFTLKVVQSDPFFNRPGGHK